VHALLSACKNQDFAAARKAWAALGAPNLRGVMGYWPNLEKYPAYHYKARPDHSAVDFVVRNDGDLGHERPSGTHRQLLKLLQDAGSRLTENGLTHCLLFYKLLDSWVKQGLKLDGFDFVDVPPPDDGSGSSFFEFFLLEVGSFEGVRMILEHCKRWIKAGVQIWPFCGPHKVSPAVPPPCIAGASRRALRQRRVVELLWQDGNDQESDFEGVGRFNWSRSDKAKLIQGLWAAGSEHRRNSAFLRRGTLLMCCRRGSLRAKGLAAFLQRIHQAAPELLMSVLKFV